jgi:CRP-like cAMP-binding protein
MFAQSHFAPPPSAIQALSRATMPLRPTALPASGAHGDLELLRRAWAPARPDTATLEALRAACRVVQHPIGTFNLPSPADPLPAWWLLRRGRMALGWINEQGHFIEKQQITAGDWLEVAGAALSTPAWLHAAQCRTPVELLVLPLDALYQACAQDPALLRAVGALLCSQVHRLNDTLNDVVTADVPARLARWLLRRLDESATPGATRLVLTELKQAIAAQLGTTSETLSRALRRLDDAGVVQVRGYELTVFDRPALQSIAWPQAPAGSARQSFATRRRGSASAA